MRARGPRRTRSAAHASATAPPCAGVAWARHRDRSILSTSSRRIRPASRGTFQPRCRTFRASQNVPTLRSALGLSPVADFTPTNVDKTARTFLRRLRTYYRPFQNVQNVPTPIQLRGLGVGLLLW